MLLVYRANACKRPMVSPKHQRGFICIFVRPLALFRSQRTNRISTNQRRALPNDWLLPIQRLAISSNAALAVPSPFGCGLRPIGSLGFIRMGCAAAGAAVRTFHWGTAGAQFKTPPGHVFRAAAFFNGGIANPRGCA